MSRICLTLPGPDCSSNERNIHTCLGTFSALEVRIDLLRDSQQNIVSHISDLVKYKNILSPRSDSDFSIILTLRHRKDGGAFTGTVRDSEAIFTELINALSSRESWSILQTMLAIDIEMHSEMPALLSRMKKKNISRICSMHSFENCPSNLMELLQNSDGIAKLALTAKNLDELNYIIDCGQRFSLRFPDRPFILIAMGEHGIPSRILPEKTGSWISFASVDNALAPGQLSSKALLPFRRFPIDRETPIFAIIGKPVAHSRSPEYHNNYFFENSIQASYIPLHCSDTASVPAFSQLVGLKGASVTIPHKESIRKMLDYESEECTVIGAANTIYQDTQGKWHGANTDVEGFLRPIHAFLQQSGTLYATVIGAGGAARSIVYALLREGSHILLLNRSSDRAEKLAEDMDKHFPGKICVAPLSPASIPLIRTYKKLIVQTTSIGMESSTMKSSTNADPLPFYTFDGSEFLYDIVYTPARTPIMERALLAGCQCKNGWEMFLTQAELQAHIFAQLLH